MVMLDGATVFYKLNLIQAEPENIHKTVHCNNSVESIQWWLLLQISF